MIDPDDVSAEIEVDSNGDENVPEVGLAADSLSSFKEDVISNQLTDEEKEAVAITVDIPAEPVRANRVFSVVRVHDGETDIPADQDDDPKTVTFLTDRFSAYAVVYQDTDGSDSSDDSEDKNVNTGVMLTVVPFIAAAVGIAASKKRR